MWAAAYSTSRSSLAQIGAQGCNLGIRSEAAAQQAVGMKLAQPRGIADIGFAPRHILGVPRIDQNDIKAALLQDLVDRDPVDPGGFHRDTGHAASL